jgi:NitT/TauT family transport system substrate-binding protein
MRQTEKILRTAGIVAVFLAFFGNTGLVMAQQLPVWRHGVVKAKSDSGFVMMANRHGFDQKYGLKIETLEFNDGQLQVRALISGAVDSIESGVGEEIVAAGAGADVKIFGCSWPSPPQGVLAKIAIAVPQDLKGKTIATSAPGSVPDLLAHAILEKYGMTSSDVQFAGLGGDNDRYKALISGVVDAAVVSSEYLPVAPKGVHLLVSARDIMPNYMRWCFASTGKRLEERHAEAVSFMAAEIDALRYAVSHRDETVKLTREVVDSKPDDPRPEFMFDQVVDNKMIDPEISIPTDKIQWMQDLFLQTGSLRTKFDLAKMIDAEIRTKALAKIKN